MGNSSCHRDFSAQYVSGSHIATGAFALVKKCTRRSDHQQFAVKIVKKSDRTRKELRLIKDEIAILKSLTRQSYPNVVHLEHVFEDEKAVIIVMELCHTSNLLDIIVASPNRRLKEKTCAQITFNIAKSLQYLHAQHIVHRDLKPENILFSTDGKTLKIADFGSAKRMKSHPQIEGEPHTQHRFRMKSIVGSPYYVAPEILSKSITHYTNKVDVWSLGVTLHVMLCGFPPFSARKGIRYLYKNIRHCNYSFASPIWHSISSDAKDLVKQLLCLDVAQRLCVDEILSHRWILKYNYQ